MKHIIPLLVVFLFSISCNDKEQELYKEGQYSHFYERIAVDEFYRKIIGYDSIEIMGKFMDEDKLQINFCYPNEWEREKYKIIGDIKFDTTTRFTVTTKDTLGRVITFISTTNPPNIPSVDTSIYKIIKTSK